MKNYLIGFICLAIIVFATMLFVGCNKTNEYQIISDIRYGIYDSQTENYNATFVYGLREDPYKMDGISNKKVEFGIISVNFLQEIEDNEIINYTLIIDENSYTGVLEKNPFADVYMANIGKVCKDSSTISLTIKIGEEEAESVNLENKSQSFAINYEKAMEIGLDALKDEIDNIKDNNESYEIYVKIISEPTMNFGKYYWLISVVSSSQRHNIILTTNSEEIIVKN